MFQCTGTYLPPVRSFVMPPHHYPSLLAAQEAHYPCLDQDPAKEDSVNKGRFVTRFSQDALDF